MGAVVEFRFGSFFIASSKLEAAHKAIVRLAKQPAADELVFNASKIAASNSLGEALQLAGFQAHFDRAGNIDGVDYVYDRFPEAGDLDAFLHSFRKCVKSGSLLIFEHDEWQLSYDYERGRVVRGDSARERLRFEVLADQVACRRGEAAEVEVRMQVVYGSPAAFTFTLADAPEGVTLVGPRKPVQAPFKRKLKLKTTSATKVCKDWPGWTTTPYHFIRIRAQSAAGDEKDAIVHLVVTDGVTATPSASAGVPKRRRRSSKGRS